MNIEFKYGIDEMVYYPRRVGCKLVQNSNDFEIIEGKITGLSIRKGYKGKLFKTVDFKGINGIPEEYVSKNKEDVTFIINNIIKKENNL